MIRFKNEEIAKRELNKIADSVSKDINSVTINFQDGTTRTVTGGVIIEAFEVGEEGIATCPMMIDEVSPAILEACGQGLIGAREQIIKNMILEDYNIPECMAEVIAKAQVSEERMSREKL